MKFLDKEIKQLNLEVTNRCALACPGCSRTRAIDHFRLHQSEGKFELKDLSLAEIKELEPLLVDLEHLTLSGSFGDALYHPQFLDILKYLVDLGINHTIETNGSGKSIDFWQNVANTVCPERTYWVFSIDGLADSNHLYRRNSKWESILTGVKALAPKCKVTWKYIVFSHNEHQIELARQLAAELGVYEFSLRAAGHLPEGSNFYPAKQKFSGFKRENKARVKSVLKDYRDSKLTTPVDEVIRIFPACLESQIDVFISATNRFYPCCGTEYESEGAATDPASWFSQQRTKFSLANGIQAQLNAPHWQSLRASWQSIETASIECIKRCGVHRDYWSEFEQQKKNGKDLELTIL